MKVAAVAWTKDDLQILTKVRETLELAEKEGIELVVFPALIGGIAPEKPAYLAEILRLSREFPKLIICPGSWWEEDTDLCHTSALVKDGEVILKQRQLYLARWERQSGLSRGSRLNFTDINGVKTAIILSTDVFYPQVWRYAALSGAEMILSPVAIKGNGNCPDQLKGVWQNVQANLVYAVESGFKGDFQDHHFSSKSVIHAPLAITPKEDGFIAVEDDQSDLVVADLDFTRHAEAIAEFDPLRQLNPGAYQNLFATAGDERV